MQSNHSNNIPVIPLHHWKIRFLCCPCFASVVGTWFVHTLKRSCFLSFSILVATETKLSCIDFPWWAALTIEATEAGGAWRNTFWGGRQLLSSRNFIPPKIRISSSNDQWSKINKLLQWKHRRLQHGFWPQDFEDSKWLDVGESYWEIDSRLHLESDGHWVCPDSLKGMGIIYLDDPWWQWKNLAIW